MKIPRKFLTLAISMKSLRIATLAFGSSVSTILVTTQLLIYSFFISFYRKILRKFFGNFVEKFRKIHRKFILD